MKQIEVSIMGQSYLLGCPEGGEARLKEAVSHVDREMCAIRDSGKLKARERIAVLSALNLAYELTERPAAAAPVVAPSADSADVPSPEHVDKLIARIDQVLGQDGHLI
ncbi:MAG: cell division protein ZapA [Aquabacterium sp.]|uniref:cell division protein ZapA n=1 Tax=Aquabacterium sp. TaxID=1872578 RepID=UPI002723F9A8|nr:cell division protein ZapA [Aquabacterium sp.]MDO9006449.1 cell division protein ZapA [Aquabacterium sp.]